MYLLTLDFMMNYHESFNDSYERCNRNPQFFHLFYDIFRGKGEKYRQVLDRIENIDNQIQMLNASIILIFMAPTSEQARMSVRQFGKRHGPKGIGVDLEDYDVWFESLLEAVKLCDSEYSEETEKVWTQYFALGMQIMKEECLPVDDINHTDYI